MGCCESREKEEDKSLYAKAIDSVFSGAKSLEGREALIRELDDNHFSHSFQLNSTKRIREVYEIEKNLLGEGASGKVRIGKNRSTQALRAVKEIYPYALESKGGVRALQHEVGIMRMLDHPHIVKLYEVFHDLSVYLVMELCTGGELFDRIVSEAQTGFSEFRGASYMKQILSAICYLHTHRIVHRDLKPENFIMQDRSPDALIKVIDFGTAALLQEGKALTAKVGTPQYVAPEVFARAGYGHKVDIWSCGVVVYILLSGFQPFGGKCDKQIMDAIRVARYSFPDDPWKDISEDAKDFIRSMMTLNADDRLEASDLLQHRWIQNQIETQKRPLPPSLGKNFQSFNASRKLKRLALTLIATQMQHTDIDELHKQFMALDTNGDGVLSKEELEEGFPDMTNVMDLIDTDGSGKVDWTEFMAAALDHQQYQNKDVLFGAFHVFDLDGDGTITKSELKHVLEVGSGAGITDAMLDDLIKEADEDGDGTISFEEFKKMMADGLPSRTTSNAALEDRAGSAP